jgi:hypothetical protein
MKNSYILLLLLLIVSVTSCVDDYTDANPPHLLDAPTLRLSASGSGQIVEQVPVNAYQYTYNVYQKYGSTIEYTVSVIDAPGKVAEVTLDTSAPEFGTLTLDDASVAALMGQEHGSFKFTFVPNAVTDFADRPFNIIVTVSDSQISNDGESAAKTTTMTIPTTLVKCLDESLEEGLYVVTEASGNLDGNVPFTLDDLKADGEVDEILVEVAMDRSGLYTIDEVTGGVWPIYYSGRANPALQVDVCGTTISGHEGGVTAGALPGPLRTFTIDGTLNGDGTIDITWSYERTDGVPTPAGPAKGTYTIAKVE